MKVTQNTYGKAEVRFLKKFDEGSRQSVREISVSVRLEGDFVANYTEGDNASCVPTDTIKNTVFALGRSDFDGPIETFACGLSAHYLGRYSHLTRALISIVETPWERIAVAGEPHRCSFSPAAGGKRICIADANREVTVISGGISDYQVLKSTESGFVGFHQCDLTSLPPTEDRILATTVNAIWSFHATPSNWDAAYKSACEAMMVPFCEAYSPSVQRTLFLMAEAAMNAVPEIQDVNLNMPNQHWFPFDLDKVGRDNPEVVFYPAATPYGDIEATVSRD